MLVSLVMMILSGPSVATPASVSEALRAGCKVQQTHTPAGKPVSSAPIIRCDREARARLQDLRAGQAVAR